MGVFENDILYCPKQNEDISEGRSNRDVKVRIHAIEVFCPHTRVDPRFDGTIGFHFEMRYQEKRMQDRKIYNWPHTPSFLGN
jgi:hypothetical protein